ncbi:ABC transporter permease [Variovorax sp. J22G21]|uniref:ABC transporter permease n=1 Tax=Variovorax fucosicus TaxID=3053517 RepID=UPI0025759507|nr:MULTISPECIES: ABC transporter permease [unclassified Variovorax]MDM0038249.1 ABC transporter permease [Variovorax sp. J22R193]MDM0063025.1 ABC transporter permease [Variovorax sp. J22G21]
MNALSSGTVAAAPRQHRSALDFLVAHGPELSLIVLCIGFALSTDTFLTFRNLLNVLDQLTVLGIMALGMTAVIVIGGIDLSVGSVLALSMMVMGSLANVFGVPMPLAIVAALVVGAVCGAVSGLLVTRANLPAFIGTLAMMSIARGLANMVTDGSQIVGYPDWFSAMSINRHFGFLSITVALFIVLTVLAALYMKYRTGGRALYAIGGSAEVARLAGIPVKRVTLLVYTVCGLLAGLAGVVMSTRLDSSQPSGGLGYELDTIAAVVIGGASLSGGVGTIWGTLMGVLTIGVLRNGLNLVGVSPFVQQIIIGVVIVLAVAVDANKRRIR